MADPRDPKDLKDGKDAKETRLSTPPRAGLGAPVQNNPPGVDIGPWPLGLSSIGGAMATVRGWPNLLGFQTVTEDERARTTFLYGAHHPELARRTAGMMERSPHLFHWVPFTGAALHAEEKTVDELVQFRAQLAGTLRMLDDTLFKRRRVLAQNTDLVVDGTTGLIDNRMTPPGVRNELIQAFSPCKEVIDSRKADITGKSRATLLARDAVHSAGDDKVAQATSELDLVRAQLEQTELENRVLRGQPLPDIPRPRHRDQPAPARRAERKGGKGDQ